MIPNLIRLTRFIPQKEGKPHRCRAAAEPSNRKRKGRPKHGTGVPWLRAYLCAIAKCATGRHPWAEVDLNRCFNAKGFSLSWGRELFRRLTRDPFFRNLCKVRFIQKRLERNGCFVILVAWRPYLQWDQEPLFYLSDKEAARHVRTALRSEDLEDTRDCPVSEAAHTNAFSTQGTAVQNNGFAAENQSRRFAQDPIRIEAVPFNKPSSNDFLRISLKLRKKAEQLTIELRSLTTWSSKVPFLFQNGYAFALDGLTNGYLGLQILRAWQRAVEQTHADAVDGIADCPQALCLFYARRLLAKTDSKTRWDRMQNFYRARRSTQKREKEFHSVQASESAINRRNLEQILKSESPHDRDTPAGREKIIALCRTIREGLDRGTLQELCDGNGSSSDTNTKTDKISKKNDCV